MLRLMLVTTVFASLVSGCGDIHDSVDAVKSTPQKMDNMQREIERTNDTVERQPVVLAFEAMLKEEYAQDLSPIPFNIMGFAKEFGKYATVEDLVELFYVKIKELNEVTLSFLNPTPEQIFEFNHKKLHTLVVLQAVAGLLPQEKVERIVNERILTEDRYQAAALSLLMLRVQFIRDVLLEASLFSSPLELVGELEKAIEYVDNIEYIARLRFTDKITVAITGFIDPESDVIETMDSGLALVYWRKVKTKASRGIKVRPTDWTGNKEEDEKLYQKRQERFIKAMDTVNSRISSWEAK